MEPVTLLTCMTGFIRELVERKQHIDAIRFIYAFGLVSDFPPVPLLKEYLNHSKAAAGRILRKGKKTPEAQVSSACFSFYINAYNLI